MDEKKIKEATRLFLEGIGEDPSREGLVDTPDRIARMCKEIFAGYECDAKVHLSKVFHTDLSGMILEKDIPFHSLCEHHLLPFFGKVTIGYLPDQKVVGLSKLARTVEVYARRAQIQEQMTDQIATAIYEELEPKGVIVMVEAEHMCMAMRGIKKIGALTTTMAQKGDLSEKDLANFFEMRK